MTARRTIGLVVSLGCAAGLADEPETYELPSFGLEADGGAADEEPAFPSDGGVLVVPPLAPAPSTRPAPPPRWGRISGGVSLLATGLTQVFLGAEVALFGALAGTPAPSENHVGHAEGWLLMAGAHGAWGAVGADGCRGTPLCGTRGLGGLSLKGGWAHGLVDVSDGVAHPQAMYFAQLDVALSRFEIESAPLAPGLSTWELLTRLRLGLHWTSGDAATNSNAFRFMATLVFEAIPVSDGTQTVSLGASLGLGF